MASTEYVDLPEDVVELLRKLAQESNVSTSFFLRNLIVTADENRHSQFQPGRGFVRVRCGLTHCFEQENRMPGGHGD